MKKFLTAVLSLALLAIQFMVPVCAEEVSVDLEKIYEKELESAIISGTGTENDPYILNYEKAPNFERFVKESWIKQNGRHENKAVSDGLRSGFVGNCLTVYQGKPIDGAVWNYTSGGMSVSSDGNLRIIKVAYNTVDQTHALAAAANYSGFWPIIRTELLSYVKNNKTKIAARLTSVLTKAGIASIKGYSASKIANAIAKCAGAGASVYGSAKLAYDILNALLNVSLNNASKNNKTYVHVEYMTAYHNEWYKNSVGEAGWTDNKVYTPSETYGRGNYYPN